MNIIESLADKHHAHLQALQCVEDWDFTQVGRKVQKDLHGVTSTYVDEGIANLKRYYALAALEPGKDHAVSQPVDPFWHAHILFSHDYSEFCERAFGHYLHHVPLDHEDTAAVSRVRAVYEDTLQGQRRYFGNLNEAWWPAADMPNALQCKVNH